MSLTTTQIRTIIIIERAASILSLIGCTFVITTFCIDGKFRKPINRLVFFATFGNILTNIATLISTAGIEAGQGSSLCQFQAFLIQWFMPADACWTFAMACNVWLSFFRSYDVHALRRIEWKYLLGCYGAPFVPAIILLFVQTQNRGRAYGSAVLWCWVSLKWDFLRVATFYGPVWIVILCTLGIYVKVGKVILKYRKQLIQIGIHGGIAAENEYPATGIVKTSEVTVITSNEDRRGSGRPHLSDRPFSGYIRQKASFIHRSSPSNQTPKRTTVQRAAGMDPNKAAVKYCKCALLFFCALIITWVPSTVNRIYTIFRPDDIVFGLNVAAATVLPLQGFWNTIIYVATSKFAMRSLWSDTMKACSVKYPYLRHQESTRTVRELEDRCSVSSQTRYDMDGSSFQSDLMISKH